MAAYRLQWCCPMNLNTVSEVKCSDCGRTTLHLLATLEQTFLHLSPSARDDQQIPYACPQCRRLVLADVLPNPGILTEEGPLSEALHEPSFLVALECADKNCRFRVEILFPREPGIDVTRVKTRLANYSDDGLMCEAGHRLWRPYQIGGIIELLKRS